MKKFICITGICLALISVSFSQTQKPKEPVVKVPVAKTENLQKKKVTAKEVYTCPMHPEVIKDKPGKCPKCGMNLVKKAPVKTVEPKKK